MISLGHRREWYDPSSSIELGGTLVNHQSFESSPEMPTAGTSAQPSKATQVDAGTHPVLSRLLEEVRNEKSVETRYDRVHNRHNRGR